MNMTLDSTTVNQPSQFQMPEFGVPVSGVVFEGSRVKSGIPLGGLGTGYVSINGDGTLGGHTIFSPFNVRSLKVPQYQLPFLFLKSGEKKLVLSSQACEGWQPVNNIRMWGHFPVVDMQFESDLPLAIKLKSYSSFLPGEADESNIPAILFQVTIKNNGAESIPVESIFAFPGMISSILPSISQCRQFSLHSEAKTSPWGTKSHFLAVQQNSRMECDYFVGVATGNLDRAERFRMESVPHPLEHRLHDMLEGSASAQSVSVVIHPGEEIAIPYVLSWYTAFLYTFDSHPHQNRYVLRFEDSVEVATYMSANGSKTLRRIHAWQEAIFRSEYPVWLQDLLVNSLYSLTKNTFLFVNPKADTWWGEEGLFTHNESFDGCCLQETMVCRMHGHFPSLFLFPKLEKTTLDAFRYYQLAGGEIPFAFGMGTGIEAPVYRRQHPINTSEYIQMIYRYYLRTGDKDVLHTYYASVKSGIRFMQTLDSDKDGLVNDHPYVLPGTEYPANQFYDTWPWYGTSAYVAGIWLSSLQCAAAIAGELDLTEDKDEYERLFKTGLEAYIETLWNGKYLNLYHDKEKGEIDETCLGNQLMLEWCNHIAGLDPILSREMTDSVLQTIDRWNAEQTPYGLVNGYHPGGKLDNNDHAKMIFVGEMWCACMTYMYKGQVERGMELAEQIYQALIEHGQLWEQHCIIHPADGSPVWGRNYYSNLIAWALPMAYNKESIKQFAGGQMLSDILACRKEELG